MHTMYKNVNIIFTFTITIIIVFFIFFKNNQKRHQIFSSPLKNRFLIK